MEGIRETLAEVGARVEGLAVVINELRYSIQGNGQPGIKVRLDRLEQSHIFTKWVVGLFATAVIGAIISLYFGVRI